MIRAIAAILTVVGIIFPAAAQQPQGWGPVAAYTVAVPLSPPPSLAGGASWTSPCVPSSYARGFTSFAALAAVGTISAQRYADASCAHPVGAPIPTVMGAPTPLVLTSGGGCPGTSFCGSNSSNDGLPYATLEVTITDTSGSTNAVVAVDLLLGAE